MGKSIGRTRLWWLAFTVAAAAIINGAILLFGHLKTGPLGPVWLWGPAFLGLGTAALALVLTRHKGAWMPLIGLAAVRTTWAFLVVGDAVRLRNVGLGLIAVAYFEIAIFDVIVARASAEL